MSEIRLITEGGSNDSGRVNVALVAGDVRFNVAYNVAPDGYTVRGLERLLAAADDRAMWAAELSAMADEIDQVGAGESSGAYRSLLAAEFRESAATPPDCEDGFRFRLCLILDWHPTQHKMSLDAAVKRARERKAGAACAG